MSWTRNRRSRRFTWLRSILAAVSWTASSSFASLAWIDRVRSAFQLAGSVRVVAWDADLSQAKACFDHYCDPDWLDFGPDENG
jgi:hypothetical protein